MSPRWDDAVRVRSWFSNARGSMLQCEFVSERAGNSAGVLCGLSCLLSQEKQARPWSDQGPGQTTPSSFSGRVKKPTELKRAITATQEKNSSAHKHLVRLTPAASRLRSTATYFHPHTAHGFENAQLMFFSGAQNVSYSEPGVQGGRLQILKDKGRSAPKAQINIKYMFYNRSGNNQNMTVWPSGLRRWLQVPVCKGVGSNPTAVRLC